MAFKLKFPDHVIEKVAREKREIERLYALPDRWLAQEILRLARLIRERTAYASELYHQGTYNSTILRDIVPELARRLGAPIKAAESTREDLRQAQGQDFRDYVATCLANVCVNYFWDSDHGEALAPADILFHSRANGNPIAMALDRVAPPTADSQDRLALLIEEMSKVRGFTPVKSWSPELSGPAPNDSDLDIVFDDVRMTMP